MSDLGADLHPLAQAALRYFLDDGAARTELEPTVFLDELFGLAARLSPREFSAAADDLLAVSRFLLAEGRPRPAAAVAERLQAGAHRATVRAAGAGALSAGVEHAGARYGRFVDRQEDRLEVSATDAAVEPDSAIGARLAEKWSTMGEARREKLARLADQLLEPEAKEPEEP